MPLRSHLLTSVLATALYVAPAIAFAGGAVPQAAPVGPLLLSRAEFWHAHGNEVFAKREVDRALAVAPADPDVLFYAAEYAFAAGDSAAGDNYRARFLAVAPTDPRAAGLRSEQAMTPERQAILDKARGYAHAGDRASALATYAKLFTDGEPPPALAAEYYLLMGSTDDGFDEARDKLGALAARTPADASLQLAFARLETLNPEARSDGVVRLQMLAGQEQTAERAKQYWHEAILWDGPSIKARARIDAYVARFGTDPAIDARLKEFAAVLPDDGMMAMWRGYNLLGRDLPGAEKQFRIAVAAHPNDADAAFMLAMVLRRENRTGESEPLLYRAMTLAPERAAEMVQTIGGVGKLGPDTLVQVDTLSAKKQFAQAAILLATLIKGQETPALLVQLADLQQRAGQADKALDSVHRARAGGAVTADADCGAAAVLIRLSHPDEARPLLDDAQRGYADAHDTGGLRRVNALRMMANLGTPGGDRREAAAAGARQVASVR